ncbi:Ferredoxin-dependent glutamate synthase [Hondaea fermentalgiana]|uniref:Glutamate synthase [NADH] n=1 Tax=Hondaea fermentalgiana TaxID=2315210 RepID=A0A2R5GJE8_9STRA|nr:Ferredoxin-dependent glutamate synthase [Hondaea fermentalgiana]|eukprot:GBG31016.1 Ferredoxin-dependent glutamate synthase [Hondaea fermentalgiana]
MEAKYDAAADRFRGFSAMPEDTGLYVSQEERDACGVGFIANFKSKQSSTLVQDALVMLTNMDHRGGCGCEVNSGDGAGIMIGMPTSFFHKVAKAEFGVTLPKVGEFAVGNIFLSHEESLRAKYKGIVEKHLAGRGIKLIGWRKAPTDNSTIGRSALKTEPWVEQLFVQNTAGWDSKKFDLMLFVVSQSVRREALQAREQDVVYICSLSSATMVFKGQLTSSQVREYYKDLQDPELKSHFALVHSRFSTNTFPSWDRAHPNRVICHNGEINTLRGNKNMMFAREGQMVSPLLQSSDDSEMLKPVCSEDYSDSGNFDACLELLCKASPRSLPEAVMMMLPEAWQNNPDLTDEKRGFYEFNSCLMEPWDGPAMIAFADGRFLGCVLDRNGLRPHRYYVTEDVVVAASEVGVIPHIPEESVVTKGRLQPGKMFLVDFAREGIVGDVELKHQVASAKPYTKWVSENMMRLKELSVQYPRRAFAPRHDVQLEEESTESPESQLNNMLNMFGYSVETLEMLLPPMVKTKKEALGSMGVDTPLACLSNKSRSIFDYFKQLFAQVTNPPMDSIREEVVMAMECPVGPMGNILEVMPSQAGRLLVKNPILRPREAECMLRLRKNSWKTVVINATFEAGQAPGALDAALNRICAEASEAIRAKNATCLFITDRAAGPDTLPIPSLIALGAVHQHLLRTKERTRVALVIEGGDAREVHHFCCLIGFGADAIYPYMAYEALGHLWRNGKVSEASDMDDVIARYITACSKGIRKVLGKIGIATVQSYKSAQIFEAVGVGEELVERCFKGTASRVGGIRLDTIERDIKSQHAVAWPRATPDALPSPTMLFNPGEFHFRSGGEEHYNDVMTITGIQATGRSRNREQYFEYAKHANAQAAKCTLRGLLRFRDAPKGALSLDEVEPASEIVKRFVTGAMSLGSISKEAHEALAIAMNTLGGKSNTGEGGEDPERFTWVGHNGESKRSSIKQVASGRFGVSSLYLANADEIQIKMAQGAKPGEGGELPGKKVFGQIAVIRNSTEGVGLISPPPHHDIYSIEDLAQLIHDLKNANPRARISVKLVSEVGVGVIAAGVAKAKADHIVVSGGDGGTGAAAWTGIKHAGLPWELGIAETHQSLVLNNLRSRVTLQTDGQMKTGRDVAIAFLLGAEEVAFATAPLIALGCIMMRKCHLNTCPVGIATQDPVLRKKFFGKPEYVINFLFMVAEEVRTIMAQIGMRSVEEMVGRADLLEADPAVLSRSDKTQLMDLSKILIPSTQIARNSPLSLVSPDEPVLMVKTIAQDHSLDKALDMEIIRQARPALEKMRPVQIELDIVNINRTVGTMLSYEISRRFGNDGLPTGTIRVVLTGSAGQSLGAFLARGVLIECVGDANDFFGKGLSGGHLVVRPQAGFLARAKAEEQVIVGNTCFFGATRGRGFVRGIAGERFCVRNSGAVIVAEGAGDHCLEYMTGGRVTILGVVGRNACAGMSGGIAYFYSPQGEIDKCVNKELVSLTQLDEADLATLRNDLELHHEHTGSTVAERILSNWSAEQRNFVKAYPNDLRRVIEAKASEPGFRLPAWFPTSDPVPDHSPNSLAHGAKGVRPSPVSAQESKLDTESKSSVVDIEDL